MKKPQNEFVEDVESLLEESVLQEAAAEVWKTFEGALSCLDEDSLYLLRQHFDGKTLKELAASRNLPEKDTQAWLEKAKRQVAEGLRRGFTVRQ